MGKTLIVRKKKSTEEMWNYPENSFILCTWKWPFSLIKLFCNKISQNFPLGCYPTPLDLWLVFPTDKFPSASTSLWQFWNFKIFTKLLFNLVSAFNEKHFLSCFFSLGSKLHEGFLIKVSCGPTKTISLVKCRLELLNMFVS